MICPSCNRDVCCVRHCDEGSHYKLLGPLDISAMTKAAEALKYAQQKEWFGTDVVALVEEISILSLQYPSVGAFLLRVIEDYRTEYAKHYSHTNQD